MTSTIRRLRCGERIPGSRRSDSSPRGTIVATTWYGPLSKHNSNVHTGEMVPKVYVRLLLEVFLMGRMVSPVWYTVRRVGEAMYDLRGEHDVDASWMAEVRGKDARGENVGRIMPRFTVEGWDQTAYQELASNQEAVEELIRLIIEQVKYHPPPLAAGLFGC